MVGCSCAFEGVDGEFDAGLSREVLEGGKGVGGADDAGEFPGEVSVEFEASGDFLRLSGVGADGVEEIDEGTADALEGESALLDEREGFCKGFGGISGGHESSLTQDRSDGWWPGLFFLISLRLSLQTNDGGVGWDRRRPGRPSQWSSTMAHARAGLLVRPVVMVALAGAASAVGAPPALIVTSLADDLSSDGDRAVGLLFDAQLAEYQIYRWQRGVGFSVVPGLGLSAEPVRGSSDLSVLATGRRNDADWGGLNCFAGYCTFGDCTPGEPLPPLNPCSPPNLAHSWSAGTGWVNAGSVPRQLDAATGRFFGGTRCDSSVNTANDLSGNGRYIVGGAWSAQLLRSDGEPGSGLCGDFVAFIADRTLGTVAALPVQPGTTISRADSVNHDGTVITGYDQGEVIDPEFGPYEGRRICVWTDGVQTILDNISSSFSTFPVNPAGTVVAGFPSASFSNVTFGTNVAQLVRWVRQNDNSWVPEALGRPADFLDSEGVLKPFLGLTVTAISEDGNTIVGTAGYGNDFFDQVSRAFIWNPNINDGVPMDLGAYVASLDPSSPIVTDGLVLSAGRSVSANGNAIGVSLSRASECDPSENGLPTLTHGVLYLDGAQAPCDAPRVAMQPRGDVSIQYTPFGVAINAFVSGSWPLSFQWQREDPNTPGQWINLSDACSGFPYGGEWNYEGTTTNQLRVGQATCGNNRDGRYRVIVSNPCGSIATEPAEVTFQQGTTITQQPVDATGCPGSFVGFFSIAISNSADLASQWEIAPASDPENFVPLDEGPNVAPDGRELSVFGAGGQFLGITPGAGAMPSSYRLRCQFVSPCGNAITETVSLTICPADFTCDGFLDFFDFDAFIACFENTDNCPFGRTADFDGDGFVDFFDFDAFVAAFEVGC